MNIKIEKKKISSLFIFFFGIICSFGFFVNYSHAVHVYDSRCINKNFRACCADCADAGAWCDADLWTSYCPSGWYNNCGTGSAGVSVECCNSSDCDDGKECTTDSCIYLGEYECNISNKIYGTACSTGICDGSGNCVSQPTLGESCDSDNDQCLGQNVYCNSGSDTCSCTQNFYANPAYNYSDCNDDGGCECNTAYGNICKNKCEVYSYAQSKCTDWYEYNGASYPGGPANPEHEAYCCDACGGGESCTNTNICLDGRNPADICSTDSCLDSNSCHYISGTKDCSAPPSALPYDLIVEDITWTPSAPTAGQTVTFSAVIKNIGTGPSPANAPIGVGFGSTFWYYNSTTESIPAGGTKTVTANNGSAWTAVAGVTSFTAFVDDAFRLCPTSSGGNCAGFPLESSRSNNTRTESVTATPIAPSSLTVSCDAITSRLSISWSAVTGTNLWYALRIDDSPESWTGGSGVATVPDFLTDGLTATSYNSYIGAPSHTYKVWVNSVIENGATDIWGTTPVVTYASCGATPVCTGAAPDGKYYAACPVDTIGLTSSLEWLPVGSSSDCTDARKCERYLIGYTPTLDFYADSTSIESGTATTLHWNTANTTTCYATGDWGPSNKNELGGSESTGNLTTSKTYYLECWNNIGETTGKKAVTVNINTSVPFSCADSVPSGSYKCSGDDTGLTFAYTWHEVGTSSASCTVDDKCEYYTPIDTPRCTQGTRPFGPSTTPWPGDDSQSIPWVYSETDTTRECEYHCANGYVRVGDVCVAGPNVMFYISDPMNPRFIDTPEINVRIDRDFILGSSATFAYEVSGTSAYPVTYCEASVLNSDIGAGDWSGSQPFIEGGLMTHPGITPTNTDPRDKTYELTCYNSIGAYTTRIVRIRVEPPIRPYDLPVATIIKPSVDNYSVASPGSITLTGKGTCDIRTNIPPDGYRWYINNPSACNSLDPDLDGYISIFPNRTKTSSYNFSTNNTTYDVCFRVKDELGLWSAPDYLKITVGTPTPEEFECVANCMPSDCEEPINQICMNVTTGTPATNPLSCENGSGCQLYTCPACPTTPSSGGGWKEVAP